MKNYQLFLYRILYQTKPLVVVFLALCTMSCEKTEIVETNATIICMASLTETPGSPLPESIGELLYPSGGCEGVYYRITPTFVRLDAPNISFVPELGIAAFSGNKNNPRLVERLLKNDVLPKVKVPEAFVTDYAPGFDKRAALQQEINTQGSTAHYLFYANDNRRVTKFGEESVFVEADSIRNYIATHFCGGEVGGGQSLVIVLNPPLETQMLTVAPIPSDTGTSDPAQLTPLISDFLNRLGDADRSTGERQGEMHTYDDLFAADTNVKIFGRNDALTKILPVAEYIEKVTYYKTLDRIEVKDVMVKDGEIWEIRLIEYYQ